MLYKVRAYLLFLLKSSNEHGVHSPFVYDLVTKCFYDETSKELRKKYKNYFNFLLGNHKTITIEDFGAGSKVFKNNLRVVSKMAQVTSLPKKNALLLMRLMKYFKINNVLELGSALGVASSSMAFSKPDSKIVTLEGCGNIANEAKSAFLKFELSNIEIVVGEFSKTLPSALKQKKYDLIYFDGNHTKEATLNYFHQSLDSIHNESLFIFDDIHWSQGMEEAWGEIKTHAKVKVTIDTFQWGFVFFRKEQVKEHFVIRL
jgi:predicted O-methyltransferase YrrM